LFLIGYDRGLEKKVNPGTKLSAYAMAMRNPHGVTVNHFAAKLSKQNAER
jgi:hypothetical protein